MPGTALGTEDKAINRRDKNSCLPEASTCVYVGVWRETGARGWGHILMPEQT